MGAGPPGVGSGFNVFPVYKLALVPGLGFTAWALPTEEKASTSTRPTIDRKSGRSILASHLKVGPVCEVNAHLECQYFLLQPPRPTASVVRTTPGLRPNVQRYPLTACRRQAPRERYGRRGCLFWLDVCK